MYDAADKNSKFLEAINKAALKNCQTLNEEIKQNARMEMEQAEAETHAECHKKMEREIQKIRIATVGQLAKYSSEKREQLSQRRQEIETAVFDSVHRKLAVYAATPAYRQSLLSAAGKIKDLLNSADDIILYIAEADFPMADALKTAAGACAVTTDPANTLGGIKAESRSAEIFIDDTFASRLEMRKQWFAENSGLKIV